MKLLLPFILLFATAFACSETAPQKEYKVKEAVVNEKVTMPPGEWRTFPFKVTEKGSRLNGSFDTGTEKSYPIMFYVTDPDSAVTLREKNTGSYNFRSVNPRGTIYSGSVLKELDPGDYVFLFHNESDHESKTINIRMSLER